VLWGVYHIDGNTYGHVPAPDGLFETVLAHFTVSFINPLDGDFDHDAGRDADDIDALSAAVRMASTESRFDLNSDGAVNEGDRIAWVNSIKKTWFGDSNLDGQFSSSDMVSVFQAAHYEDGVAGNSTWATGDWNGDAEFDSSDFVYALQAGGYEQGPRAGVAGVPEPSTSVMMVSLLLVGALRRRRVAQGASQRVTTDPVSVGR
jgi:hypothetical protein